MPPITLGRSSPTAAASYMRSGYYYVAQPTGTTTGLMIQNAMRATPIFVPRAVTLDRIGAEVTVAGEAGSVIRLGIYSDDGNGVPGTLLLDAGTIAGDGSAIWKEIAISQAVPAGLIWVTGVAQLCPTLPPTVRVASSQQVPVTYTSAPTSASPVAYVSGTSPTGALPTPFGTVVNGGNGIRVGVRVA